MGLYVRCATRCARPHLTQGWQRKFRTILGRALRRRAQRSHKRGLGIPDSHRHADIHPGNKPSHHIPYLYALAGAASKSQERVREIAVDYYNDTADGLAGVSFLCRRISKPEFLIHFQQNEDCGQMSAWYLFSAVGFYPVDPVSGEYVVGA